MREPQACIIKNYAGHHIYRLIVAPKLRIQAPSKKIIQIMMFDVIEGVQDVHHSNWCTYLFEM